MFRKLMIVLGLASVGSAVAYYFYKEYQLVKSWEFQLAGFKLLNYSTSKMSIEVKLKIVNVSNVEATISHLNGSVYINGIYMGTVYQTDVLAIPSRGYNFLNLAILLDNTNLANQIVEIAAGGDDAPIQIHIVGTMKINSGFIGITIPIDDTENYTLLSLIAGV